MRGLEVPEHGGEVGVIYSLEDTRIYSTSVHRCAPPHIRVNCRIHKNYIFHILGRAATQSTFGQR